MIGFHYHIPDFRIRNAGMAKAWLEACVKKEKKVAGDLHYYFVDKKKIREINRKFLRHDYVTDIITFDYCEHPNVSGEIFICPEQVKDNAFEYENGNFRREMHRVLIHGILHLCGYNDHRENQKKKMRKMENVYLDLLIKNKQ